MKPRLVFAMKEEARDQFNDHDTLITGIGKINATYALTKSIAIKKPNIVINLGTAGSPIHKTGTVINATKFIQRDMDVTPLGFKKYQTPFSNDPIIIKYGEDIKTLASGTCGSGDSFDISGNTKNYDVMDMEAYALALICQREHIPFLCLKYISDGADETAHQDWNETLDQAASALRKELDKYQAA